MRRCLHAFLVGVLVLSLSMDAARACWFLRRGCRPVAPSPSICVAPAPTWWDDCTAPAPPQGDLHDVGVTEWGPCAAVPPSFVADDGIGTGDAWTVLHSDVVDDEPSFVGESIEVRGDVVIADLGEPTSPAEEVAVPSGVVTRDAAPEPPTASVVVPDLKPAVDGAPAVQPTSAIEEQAAPPASETSSPVEPLAEEPPVATGSPVTAPAIPTAPAEPNLFEEADSTDGLDAAPVDAVPEPPPAADEAREPTPEPAGVVVPPAGESSAHHANPLDDAERRSGEAARLWVDATGRHAIVGVLVDVRADGRCVIDTGARILEVRGSDLRRRDRDYAAQAAERLVTRRGPGPAETAGR